MRQSRGRVIIIDHEPQLIAMHMPMLGPQPQSAAGGDRHLKDTAVAVMDPAATRDGVGVLAFVVVVVTGLEGRQRIEKPRKPGASGSDADRFVTKTAFHQGVGLLVGRTDARRQPNLLLERARGAGAGMDTRIGIEHHSHR